MNATSSTDAAAGDVPVMYRHAKCRNCGYQFVYWYGATPDRTGVRPECPECGKQGLSGPFGRVNPAEFLPIITQAADDSEFKYRHWLAGDAVLRIDYLDHATGDPSPRWLYVNHDPVADLPCLTTRSVDEDGDVSSGWKPHTYQTYLDNDVEMTLVSADERPQEDWSP